MMKKRINKNLINAVFTAIVLIVVTVSVLAQESRTLTPETQNADSMTYQGRLMNGGSPANGTYDFLFQVTNSSGTLVQSVEALGVPVNNGIFTARIQLNISTFATGGGAFLTVGVRQLPTDAYVPLAPSQPIAATPIAFKAHYATLADNAANATLLNGIASNQFVLTADPRLSDAREPLPGNGNYIQNNINAQQPASFNIQGAGKADVFNAHSYYLLNGFIVLAAPGSGNLFTGINAGASNATGADNSFFGREAGMNNVAGSGNAFFGSGAGKNSTADNNSFFGKSAGSSNTTGFGNSFFGFEAGLSNTGNQNTLFGVKAGRSNTTGQSNAFFGALAGEANTIGAGNIFIGESAGYGNRVGSRNIFIGASTGGNNFGTNSNDNILIGNGAEAADNVSNAIAIGPGARVDINDWIVLGSNTQNTRVSGRLSVAVYPAGGNAQLCVNTNTNILSVCSSSREFKDDIANFKGGLDLIKRLRPVAFRWKEGGMRDVGFIAEEVAEVEPLLASHDVNGEVQGVKYDRISTALVNAVNEQQGQIESLKAEVAHQEKQLQKQREQIEALKQIVCSGNAAATLCKEKE